jgi:ketosteroid isomerase-like protein
MNRLLHAFLVFVTIGLIGMGLAQPAYASPPQIPSTSGSDVDLLRQSVTDWESGWSAGDQPFSMERVDDLYDHSNRFLEFDTISPAGTVTQGYQNFKALWEPTMQASTHLSTKVDDNVAVITDGTLGLTTFTFQTAFTDRKTGEKYAEQGHASMVWEKQGGRWVIVHEHVSNPVRLS